MFFWKNLKKKDLMFLFKLVDILLKNPREMLC